MKRIDPFDDEWLRGFVAMANEVGLTINEICCLIGFLMRQKVM